MSLDIRMVETLKNTDSPRAVMLSIISGVKMAPHIKAMAYMLINTAKDKEIENLRGMFLNAVTFLGNNDTEGLSKYLSGLGLKVNAEVLNGILHSPITDTGKDQ